MMEQTHYLFDFDNTFTQVEAMEELAEISLAGNPELEFVLEKIKQLTEAAMDGNMPFGKSLKARIALLSAKKYHINLLVNKLRKKVSPSFAQNKQFFKENKGNIYIVSGGFKEFIVPIVKAYHIAEDHVFANTFVYDKKGNIIGADENNFLAQEQGKVKLVKSLKLKGKVIFVGDGYTDWEVYNAGLASQFYAYTEHVSRKKVLANASLVAPSLDEILYSQKLPMRISYPKTRLKVVFWGEATFLAEPNFKKEGYKTELLPGNTKKDVLAKSLLDCQLLVFSPTVKWAWVQPEKTKLLAAGVWGESKTLTCQKAWGAQGIVLFESKFAHTRCMAELALMHMLILSKKLGVELVNKKLGIIGFNHAASLLALMGASLGMEVFYYDGSEKPALGNFKRIKQLPDLIKKCDILVLMDEDYNAFGLKELRLMPAHALLLNLGADSSVDLLACAQRLQLGKLGGFGMDSSVKIESDAFVGLPVSFTHQERAASKETQENMAQTLSDNLLAFINNGNTSGACNFPNLELPLLKDYHRFVHIHANKPGVLAQINSLFALHKINIGAQYLQTNNEMGYVITDVSKSYDEELIVKLKTIAETIKFRVLY